MQNEKRAVHENHAVVFVINISFCANGSFWDNIGSKNDGPLKLWIHGYPSAWESKESKIYATGNKWVWTSNLLNSKAVILTCCVIVSEILKYLRSHITLKLFFILYNERRQEEYLGYIVCFSKTNLIRGKLTILDQFGPKN